MRVLRHLMAFAIGIALGTGFTYGKEENLGIPYCETSGGLTSDAADSFVSGWCSGWADFTYSGSEDGGREFVCEPMKACALNYSVYGSWGEGCVRSLTISFDGVPAGTTNLPSTSTGIDVGSWTEISVGCPSPEVEVLVEFKNSAGTVVMSWTFVIACQDCI